jgi:hypothetical protein
MVMDSQVSQKAVNFLTSSAPVGFSRRTLLHGATTFLEFNNATYMLRKEKYKKLQQLLEQKRLIFFTVSL